MAFQKLVISQRAPRGHPAAYAIRQSGTTHHKNLALHFRPDLVARLRWTKPQHVEFEYDFKAHLFRVIAKVENTRFRTVKPMGAGRLWTVTLPYRDTVATLFPLVRTVTRLEVEEATTEYLTLKLPLP